MSTRDNVEAQCHSALARYKQDIADGVWRVTADNRLVDAFLKAADKYAEHAVIGARVAERVKVAAR